MEVLLEVGVFGLMMWAMLQVGLPFLWAGVVSFIATWMFMPAILDWISRLLAALTSPWTIGAVLAVVALYLLWRWINRDPSSTSHFRRF